MLIDSEIKTLCPSTGTSLIAPFSETLVNPASYDLTVGAIITKTRDRDAFGRPKGREKLVVVSKNSASHGLSIYPGQVLTLLTAETITMPTDMAGTVFPKNAKSEDGMLVLNPGHVDPGYVGVLSLRMVNLRQSMGYIQLGDPVFTIIFEKLERTPATRYPASSVVTAEQRLRDMTDKMSASMSPSILDLAGEIMGGQLDDRFVRRDTLWFDVLKLFGAVAGIVLGATGVAAVLARLISWLLPRLLYG